jgi:glycosyltransferase involved in cell wall biosynthesis
MVDAAPRISVLMPVYNGERYLKPAIESVLAQTCGDFELLIRDDGSRDGSWKLMQAYAAEDDRLRISRQANQGIAKTRNQLLADARGEFIATMDADDVMLPERLARQVEFLVAQPQVVCVGGALDWIDERGRLLGHCEMPENDADIQQLLLGGISLLHHPCTMARRAALLQVGGYNETMVASSDLDLWLRLGEIGALANLPDTVLQYRLHRQSITHAQQAQQAADALAACQRAWKRRGIQGEFIRQPADHLKQHHFWLRCGWSNFLNGQRDIARYCGLRAISTQPADWQAWKLLACALVKPTPLPTPVNPSAL